MEMVGEHGWLSAPSQRVLNKADVSAGCSLRCTLENDLCVRKEDRKSHQIQKATKSVSEQRLDLTAGLFRLFEMIDLELPPLHDEPRHCSIQSR